MGKEGTNLEYFVSQARMAALIQERWDFVNGPQLQLMDFQQKFFASVASALAPLSACALARYA